MTSESDIIGAFEQFLSCTPQLDCLDERMIALGFTLHEGSVQFSINHLYAWIDEDGRLSTQQFTQALYRSQLNQRLQKLGYIVDVAVSTKKVDDSIYRLRKL